MSTAPRGGSLDIGISYLMLSLLVVRVRVWVWVRVVVVGTIPRGSVERSSILDAINTSLVLERKSITTHACTDPSLGARSDPRDYYAKTHSPSAGIDTSHFVARCCGDHQSTTRHQKGTSLRTALHLRLGMELHQHDSESCLLQAIKLRSRDPLCEFIPKVQSRFPMSDVDKDKLLAIIDLLDNHGFADITTQLTVLQSDVMAFEDVYDALEPELLVVDIRRVCVHVRIACVLICVACALIHACIMHSLSISTSRNAPKRSSGHRGEHQNQVLVIVHSLASCDRPSLHHAPQPHRQRKT
jgi:hypothetical protein